MAESPLTFRSPPPPKTDQDRDAAELRQLVARQEQRLRFLLDHAGDAIFVIDPATGDLLEMNRRAEELLGYSHQEIGTLPLDDLFPGRQKRRYLRLIRQVRRKGYAEEHSLVFRRRNGRTFIGAIHARAGELGDQRMVHGVVRDVTAIRRFEQELRRRNRDLTLLNELARHTTGHRDLRRMLTDVLPPALAAFGAGGGGIYLLRHNATLLHLTAHSGLDEATAREIAQLPADTRLVGQAAASGRPAMSAELPGHCSDCPEAIRREGWQSLQAIPLTAHDRTLGVLFLCHRRQRILSDSELNLLTMVGGHLGTAIEGADLFEALDWQHRLTQASNRELERSRRKLQENLDRMDEANRAMERVDRMKNQFLALASHELRTPLTCVISGAELLAENLQSTLSGDGAKIMEAVLQGGRRLEGVVNDLLEAARIESRSIYLAREKFDLAPLLQETVASFAAILERRQLTCRVGELPPALPMAGDPHHIHHAFRRLLENAVKFTREGGGIRLECRLRSVGELRADEDRLRPFAGTFFQRLDDQPFVQVTVRDNGIGIDPEDQLRIFDKFYEAGPINDHFSSHTRFGGRGVGLGLTLVKGMIESHGGMIWLESPGTAVGGSDFHVLLPLDREEAVPWHGDR